MTKDKVNVRTLKDVLIKHCPCSRMGKFDDKLIERKKGCGIPFCQIPTMHFFGFVVSPMMSRLSMLGKSAAIQSVDSKGSFYANFSLRVV